MTTEKKETEFDVRQVQEYEGGCIETAIEASVKESPTKHDLNSLYGVMGKVVRPMIQFVPGNQDTTESRLKDVREQMTFTRAKKTIRRSGWYFTEPYAPCSEQTKENVRQSIRDIFGIEPYPKMGKEDIGA